MAPSAVVLEAYRQCWYIYMCVCHSDVQASPLRVTVVEVTVVEVTVACPQHTGEVRRTGTSTKVRQTRVT